MTQPAVSRLLAQLEAHLGVRLVERSTHHLTLTRTGVAYRDRVAAAVAAVDTVLDRPHCRPGRCASGTPGPRSACTPRPCCAAGPSGTPTSNCSWCRWTTAAPACTTA